MWFVMVLTSKNLHVLFLVDYGIHFCGGRSFFFFFGYFFILVRNKVWQVVLHASFYIHFH